MDTSEIIRKLTLAEKAALLSGKNEWESRDIPRLGVNSIVFSDGPHGIRRQEGAGDHLGLNESLKATCFPTAATVANSWDEELGEEIGKALGEEAVYQKVDVLLGPGVNMKRSPLCGRNFEYFSEDPVLAGKIAAAYIRGIQSNHIYACPKHFAANSREYRRMAMNAVVDERTLREIYLTAFEIAVKEGGAKCIMSAYNEVNGQYANENEHLLVDILRNEWKFDGMVVTDWGASNDHVQATKCQSNVEMPNPGFDSAREILKAVDEGILTEKEIDRAIFPLLEAAAFVKDNDHTKDFDIEAHHRIARKAATQSAVLLKNDEGILPLKAGMKVALRGPFVEKPRYQGSGSSQVNATRVETIGDEIKAYELNVVSEMEAADVVLYFFGLDEIAESEGADRLSMDIPEYQIKEIEEISIKNSNIIGIMSAGSAVTMPWIGKMKALLHSYLGGQAGASAVLDIVTGKVNPSGKLSETYPFAYEDCSICNYADEEKRNMEYREGPFIGYRYYDTVQKPVQFPFGYGLSYTTFEYSDLSITEKGVLFSIVNTGKTAGAEIAQLYVSKKESVLIRPAKELKGFTKVFLEAGEKKTVEISFDDKTFRYFNVKTNCWEVEAGEYVISVGANVLDTRLSGTFYCTGTTDECPYQLEAFSGYRSGDITAISDKEFALLYGKELPREKKGELDINDALCQMKYARSGLCRVVYKILKKTLDKANASGVPNLNILFIYNMPFRAMSKMTAGMVSRGMAESIVTVANGHFFKGLSGIVYGFFQNRKANKQYENKLNSIGK